MRMHRGSWEKELSSSHLPNLSIRHIGTSECRKIKVWTWISVLWHNIYKEFLENPFTNYLVIECVHTNINGKKISKVGSG
jgi:hypothetical protein